MQCPRCQAQNAQDAKFCEDCGARLEAVCPSCGLSVGTGKKFCRSCGASVIADASRFTSPQAYTPKHLAEKILTSKAALEGERKQVTVLFADLKGSMELLADRDPEEARKLLDPVLEHMMEAVHRYEGTVNQVMGDGIMALFGAPLAHEDHAVRACYAALRMQESVARYAEDVFRAQGVRVQIRVGLNSGEVVVRAVGSDLHMDYTAVGQTTHLAARMEQMAAPGTIMLAPATLRLAEDYVQVTALGPATVKGLPDPVDIHMLTGASARTRLQAGVARGLTKFVGRDPEIEQIRRALDLARQGHGQLVAVVGEPGVGKSRLFHEFTRSVGGQGWLILEAGSVSYGMATSYLPVIYLLKTYCQIEARDEARKIHEKVTGKILALDRALEPTVPVFLALLDVPVEDAQWHALDPPQRRQRTLDACKRFLLRESRVRPLLLIFEDLHWIDSETQAVLDSLIESLPTARLLLLVSYRPEYQHNWGSKTFYTQVRVDSLPADSAKDLLQALLGNDEAIAPLGRLLIEQTQGNPFFLEECVRALVETKVLAGERGAYRLITALPSIQVPATVQAVLASRIDRLKPEEKRLLQAAAVVGKDVPFALLQAAAAEPAERLRVGLARLQAAEFLYEARLFPDLEYTFKHALTHEVAYGSLLHERRRLVHARIVDAIESLHRDRLGEQTERLAHHAHRGDLRERAVPYLRQAGIKAAARSALRDARVWFELALGVLEGLPEIQSTLAQAFEIRLELRAVLVQLGEVRHVLARLHEAETLADKLNDDRHRGLICAFMLNIHSTLGELDQALAAGSRALEIADHLTDLKLRLLTTTFFEYSHYLRGDYERVVALAAQNLAALPAEWVSESLGGASAISLHDRFWLVMSLAELGRLADSAEYQSQMIPLAEPTHLALNIGGAYVAGSMLHLIKGNWATARSSFIEPGLAVLRTGNVVFLLPLAVAASAWVLAHFGEWSEATSRLQEGEQILDCHAAQGLVGLSGWAYRLLGRASLLLGRLEEARRFSHRAIASSTSHPGFAAYALHLLGDIATHPDRFDADRGEAHYRQALAVAEPRGMRPLIAHCHLGLGKLFRRTGQRGQANEHLTIATTLYREMDMTYWLEQAVPESRELS